MKRIERIKERLFNKEFNEKKEWWGEGETILISEEIKNRPLIIRKALAIKHVAEKMPIDVKEDELIVGIPTMASVGFGKCFPEYATSEEIEYAKRFGFTPKSVFGHHLINYDSFLQKGLSGVRKDITRRLLDNNGFDYEMANFYKSVLISLDAVSILARRYSYLLIEKAEQTQDQHRREELIKISEICMNTPENPPCTFYEALQAVWIIFILLHSTMEFIPLGRADQYLYPFYQRDIQNGIISKEYAQELIGSWLAKFSERVHMNPNQWELHMKDEDSQFNGILAGHEATYAEYDNNDSYNFGTSANHWLINMILGGQTTAGKDATNDLTYMLLEQWAFLEAIVPVMSVRIHKNSPPKLFHLCMEIIRNGSSEPAIYNDEVIIKGFTNLGINIEDARDYSNDGCWETLIPGKTNFGFCMLQLLQILEYIFQGGMSLVRGGFEYEISKNFDSCENFDEFYNVFIYLLRQFTLKEVETRVFNIQERARIAPSPLLSAYLDDCIERGVEYSVGGARYNIFGLMLTGLANCVDSLAAIKKFVYIEKQYSISDFSAAMKANYEGYEYMRQNIINKAPKFGNDDPFVDDIAVRVLDDFSRITKDLQKAKLGDILLIPGIATFEFYAKWGHDVGASADGRKSQEPIAPNYSPVPGLDRIGPTAIIRSVTRPNLLPYTMGGPLDISINPNEVKGEQGLLRLMALVKTYLELGGLIITITGVSKEQLLAAVADPVKYRNLRVRLGGLSAYFVTLSPEMQNSLIQRT